MYWNEKQIGDYIDPGFPETIPQKLQQDKYQWKYVNVLVENGEAI